MTFNDPATGGGDKLPLDELNGSLLLITVHEETDPIDTEYGPTTAVRADVATLDGTLKGEVFADTLIFPRVLKSQLRKFAGQQVLGRLGKGEKKGPKSAPWQLTAATDEEKQTGEKYLAHVAAQAVADEEPF